MIEIKITNLTELTLDELELLSCLIKPLIEKKESEEVIKIPCKFVAKGEGIEMPSFTDTKETMGHNFTAEELKEAARDIEQTSKKLDKIEKDFSPAIKFLQNFNTPIPAPSTTQDLENIDWKTPTAKNEYEVKNIEAPDHFKPLPPITPAPVNNPVDKDIMGFPWDARIHASGKTKNKNGTWKLKRNVDTKLVEQVESDLRKTLNVPLPMPTPAFNPLLTVPTTQPAQPTTISYPQLIMKVTSTINSGKMTQQEWTELLSAHNIPDANLLSLRPDLFPAIHKFLEGIK